MSTDWNKLLAGIDFTLPEKGDSPPKQEELPKEIATEKQDDKRPVIVQKIITEIWVYTDIAGKAVGQGTIQDIEIIGEMPLDEAIKKIGERKKGRGKKNPGS